MDDEKTLETTENEEKINEDIDDLIFDSYTEKHFSEK